MCSITKISLWICSERQVSISLNNILQVLKYRYKVVVYRRETTVCHKHFERNENEIKNEYTFNYNNNPIIHPKTLITRGFRVTNETIYNVDRCRRKRTNGLFCKFVRVLGLEIVAIQVQCYTIYYNIDYDFMIRPPSYNRQSISQSISFVVGWLIETIVLLLLLLLIIVMMMLLLLLLVVVIAVIGFRIFCIMF